MADFINSQIDVQGGIQPPHKPSTTRILWNESTFARASLPSEATPVDQFLGALGVEFALDYAFSQQFSRNSVWDLTGLTGQHQDAAKAAAKVFRRGIPTIPAAIEPAISTSTRVSIFENEAPYKTQQIANLCKTLQRTHQSSDLVIVDSNVWSLWPVFLDNLSGFRKIKFSIDETSKTLETAARLANQLPLGVKRLIVVGGGVLGDVAGFVAAIKNLETVYVPTTLLSMADSSVGGKTGVNFKQWGKNQVGRFHSPNEVLIATDFLTTLAIREFNSGLAECLKHAFISGDVALWQTLIDLGSGKRHAIQVADLNKIVQVKAAVVMRDPFERGERSILNFGHTFGHGLESLSLKYDGEDHLTHGACVAIGMVYELKLSQKLGHFKNPDSFIADLKAAKVLPKLNLRSMRHLEGLSELLVSDKKNSDRAIQWVLMSEFGVVFKGSSESWTHPASFDFELLQSILKDLH